MAARITLGIALAVKAVQMVAEAWQPYDDVSTNELHHLIRQKQWKEAEALLAQEEGKAMARQPNRLGGFPLHVAIWKKGPDSLILALMHIYDQAVSTCNIYLMLPLHLAASEGASEDVIEKLIRKFPQGLEMKSKQGFTPADFAERGYGELTEPAKAMLSKSTQYWMDRTKLVKKEYQECDHCHAKSKKKLHKCGGCSKAFYCNKKCQHDHWEQHKKCCKRNRRK